MDIFDFPDDYVPEKPLTNQQMDDITDYLKNHPLFMKQLPKNFESNPHIIALQSLNQDEDPDTVAQNLCEQGSKRLRQKPESPYIMKQAYSKYTQGIRIECPSKEINAKLHCNRAAINLKVKNYRKVIEDCKVCLKYDPQYIKAYYRYAKALLAIKKYDEVVKLLTPRKEPELQLLLKQAQKNMTIEQQRTAKKQDEKNKQQKQIDQYCAARNWKVVKRKVTDPLPQNTRLKMMVGRLSIPLVVIYPEFGQFDLIQSTFENQKIKAHLQQLFLNPLPWDSKGQYSLDSIQIYVQVALETMFKIPKQCTIKEIADRITLKECIQIHVVRPGNAFYQKFKKENQFL